MLLRPDLLHATHALLAGGVVCYPNEGVFGLGCLPLEEFAVERILKFKQRSAEQGLILIGANLNQLLPWIAPSEGELQQLLSHTERPTTWVVTRSGLTPDWVSGGRDTVAVRICGHPVARQLCGAANSALVSTSANRSGRPAVKTTVRARYLLKSAVDAVVSGMTDPLGGASDIRLAADGTWIRGS